MAMDQAIRGLPEQFAWVPVIEREDALSEQTRGVVVCGMGGSALAPDMLTAGDPAWNGGGNIVVHRGYGIPELSDLDDRLVIASSYSGNTEETLDAYDAAQAAGLATAVITTGGALLERAQRDDIPHIVLPATGIQPRMAIGYSILAIAALLRHGRALATLGTLAARLDTAILEEGGAALAGALGDRTPLLYASDRNAAIARFWKIAINETGKNPAFMNTIPELNHNEMTGFDVGVVARELLQRFAVVMLTDGEDDPRIVRRAAALQELLQERGIPVHEVALAGDERFLRLFSSVGSACWTAYHLAMRDRAEPEQVPMVEAFKQRIV
ncbi:MAG: SIS domain-containing protein [bacterium]|nr:SIS domain-containing protein [bacterium]